MKPASLACQVPRNLERNFIRDRTPRLCIPTDFHGHIHRSFSRREPHPCRKIWTSQLKTRSTGIDRIEGKIVVGHPIIRWVAAWEGGKAYARDTLVYLNAPKAVA